MTRFRYVLPCAVAALFSAGTIAVGQNLAVLERALQKAGYQLYNPARANWGPGFVFAGDVVNGRIKNVVEICPTLYRDLDPPRGTTIVLSDFKSEDGFSWGLALNFLKGLLGGKLDLGAEGEQKAEVKWQNIQEMSYPQMVGWLESGEPRPIAPQCHAAIEDLKLKKLFEGRVFVIVRAVAPESLMYDFTRALQGQGGASGRISEGIRAELQGKGRVKNETQLEITQRLYVGYAAPIKLKDYVPTGLVGEPIVEVSGKPDDLIIE
jgi:hypothetical protein